MNKKTTIGIIIIQYPFVALVYEKDKLQNALSQVKGIVGFIEFGFVRYKEKVAPGILYTTYVLPQSPRSYQ